MAQQITPISITSLIASGKTHTSARAGAVYGGNTPVLSQNGRALS